LTPPPSHVACHDKSRRVHVDQSAIEHRLTWPATAKAGVGVQCELPAIDLIVSRGLPRQKQEAGPSPRRGLPRQKQED
jgi:hypothetical protein